MTRGPKGSSNIQGEKLINFEMLGGEKMAISFQGFYDNEIKERIKSVENAIYDSENRVWIVPVH